MANETEVVLHIYDLSNGMARQMSPMLLGKQIEAIYHTGIVVWGKEYYFGGGICADVPGAVPYGSPIRVERLGVTRRTYQEFLDFLVSIAPRFTVATYHLLENNCNNFTQVCTEYLIPGSSIPQEIIDLPSEAMSSPLGPALRPMIDGMQQQIQAASLGHEVVGTTSARAPTSPSQTTNLMGSCEAHCPVRFDAGKVPQILAKLREWDPDFESVNGFDTVQLEASLKRLPAEKAFPALDLLRLAALETMHTSRVATAMPFVLSTFARDAASVPRPALMMALRTTSNLLATEQGAACFPAAEIGTVVEIIAETREHAHRSVRQAASATACNLAFRSRMKAIALEEEVSVQLLCAVGERISGLKVESEADDPRELLYLLSAFGLLIGGDTEARMIAQTLEVDVNKFVSSNSVDERVRACAREVHASLTNT